MADIDETSVYFTDGYVVDKNKILIAAKLNSMSDEDFSRVLYFYDGEWTYEDIEDSVHSVCFLESPRSCYWLGRNGKIITVGGGNLVEEIIKDVERYGYVNRIGLIGSDLYICGYGGQVYRMVKPNQWIHMDDGILETSPTVESTDLQDIDGIGSDDIYTVGTGGVIHHYNGKSWTNLDSPTNLHLLRVKCVGRNEIYICGSKGGFYRGNKNVWVDCGDPDVLEDYWGLEYFNGKVYLAHYEGLMVWDGQSLAPVDMGIDRTISCHRLHANDGVLWSFGIDDLVYFDGVKWTEIDCPENVP